MHIPGTETKTARQSPKVESSDICVVEIKRSRDQEYHRDTSYPD